jgi:transcriptional regulator with XRE-family HTH domain
MQRRKRSTLLLASDFGVVLRRLRKSRSQEWLAREAGIHLNEVSLLEQGDRAPALDTVFQLAKGLKIKASEMIAAVEAHQKTVRQPKQSSGANQESSATVT